MSQLFGVQIKFNIYTYLNMNVELEIKMNIISIFKHECTFILSVRCAALLSRFLRILFFRLDINADKSYIDKKRALLIQIYISRCVDKCMCLLVFFLNLG